MQTGIVGRSMRLLPMTPEHLPWLFEWFNDVESRALWSESSEVLDAARFGDEWERRLRQRIHVIFMVHPRSSDGDQLAPPIGFCYDYDFSSTDGHTYICTYMAREARGSGKGAECTFHLLSYLWDSFPLRKVYSDVFEFNHASLNVVRHAGFVQEGRFGGHRYLNGAYHDQLRLALYRERWEELRSRYSRAFSAERHEAAG